MIICQKHVSAAYVCTSGVHSKSLAIRVGGGTWCGACSQWLMGLSIKNLDAAMLLTTVQSDSIHEV